ncbi:hypothetical protein B4U79_16807, partial [Dinothrombium tinctorium]
MAYTLNTGREHKKFSYKALLFAENLNKFELLLNTISQHLNDIKMLSHEILSESDFESLLKDRCIFFVANSTTSRAQDAYSNEKTSNFYKIYYYAAIRMQTIPWNLIYKQKRSMVPQLPTYAFEESRFWPLDSMHSSMQNKAVNHQTEDLVSTNNEFEKKQMHMKQQISKNVSIEHILNDRILSESVSDQSCAVISCFNIPDYMFDLVGNLVGNRIDVKYWVPSLPPTVIDSILSGSGMQVFIILDIVDDELITSFMNELLLCGLKGPLLIMELNITGRKRDWSNFNIDNRSICLKIFEIEQNYLQKRTEISIDDLLNREGYMYLSSLIARNIRLMITPPISKAIVVSSENDLWKEVSGQSGTILTESQSVLQSFLLKSFENRILLISRCQNNESEVFRMMHPRDERGNLLSGLNNIDVSQCHESNDLNDLCKLLDLNIEEIVVIDSDMKQCVKNLEKHPSTLTLWFPDEKSVTEVLLDSIWSFDLNDAYFKFGKYLHQQIYSTLAYFMKKVKSCKRWIDSWPTELRKQTKINLLSPFLVDKQFQQIINESEVQNEHSSLEDVWFELLGAYPTRKSHFFNCGGDSLKAIYFVTKIRQEMQVDISLRDLFLNPKFVDLRKALKLLPKFETVDSKSMEFNAGRMSSMQTRFLLLQELTPNNTAYTECCAVFSNREHLNFDPLFSQVLKAFPILTTAVTEDENLDKFICRLPPEEVVMNSLAPTIEVDTSLSAKEEVYKLKPSFKMKNKLPLVKMQPIRITNDKICKIMVAVYMHHLLVDEVSANLLETALSSFLENRPFVYNQPEKSYCDFAHKEYLYLNSVQKQKDLEIFSEQFVSKPAESCLSFSVETWTDTKIYESKWTIFELDLNVQSLCTQLEISHFHYYFCCFLLTLRQYVGENDLIVNVPVTTRSHSFDNVFGPFLNIIMFRYEFDTSQNLKNFMLDAIANWIKVQEKNLLPYDEIISFLRDSKKITRIKTYNWFNYSLVTKNNSVYIHSKHTKFPFYVNVREKAASGVEIIIEWANGLIDDSIAQNFGASFVNAIRKITHNFDTMKEQPVLSIDVMTKEEFSQILSVYREMDPMPNSLVHRYFEKHCEAKGEKIAVVSEDRKITYQQLNKMATKIAAHLQKIIPEEEVQQKPIVVMMKRDELIVASVLAIWKIGGYFLPISDDTQQKLFQLFSDEKTETHHVLINFNEDELEVEVPTCVKLIDVRNLLANACKYEFVDKIASWSAKNTFAYVYLTSGTTGKPKRCMISHENLGVFGNACFHEYKLDTFEVIIPQWLPISFDVFINDITFALLMTGGSI